MKNQINFTYPNFTHPDQDGFQKLSDLMNKISDEFWKIKILLLEDWILAHNVDQDSHVVVSIRSAKDNILEESYILAPKGEARSFPADIRNLSAKYPTFHANYLHLSARKTK